MLRHGGRAAVGGAAGLSVVPSVVISTAARPLSMKKMSLDGIPCWTSAVPQHSLLWQLHEPAGLAECIG